MTRAPRTWAFGLALLFASAAAAQLPLLHYHFNEGGSPATTGNVGTLSPGPSPLIGYTLTGTANGTPCLTGNGGTTSEVTTPLTMNLGTSAWTVGFAITSGGTTTNQYVFSDNRGGLGFRAFINGSVGVGNIQLAVDLAHFNITGGAGASGTVHVAWVHDPVAAQVRAYLNGAIVSSTNAPGISLSSGNTLRIGRLNTVCLQTGTRIDDFRFYGAALTGSQIAGWSQAALNVKADFQKVMLTEASWVAPRAFEITNFASVAASLTDWRIKWLSGSTVVVSDPLNVSDNPGESVVIAAATLTDTVPLGTQVVNRFPTGIPSPTDAFTVGLLDPIGTVVDEVRVLNPSSPTTQPPGAGGMFRGLAFRSTGPGQRSVERIWGLDSDGGTDWTEQVTRTLGRENTNDWTRGSDPVAVPSLRINEVDDTPDYLELFNPNASSVNLTNWILVTSNGQGTAALQQYIPTGTTIPGSGYLVVGGTLTAPAELPGTVNYVVLLNPALTSLSYEVGLYDNLGRLVDLVRTTSASGQNVHNHPRAPSLWSDFTGAAGRNLNGGDDAIGRNFLSSDNDSGSDWFPVFTRTMGSQNLSATLAGPAGHGDVLDVRLNETGLGQGFAAIINAGPGASLLTYNFIVSTMHSNGQGPIMGLGPDVFANFATYYHIIPFWGVLNSNGSGRIEFDSGILPPGIDADFIFFLQDAASNLVRRTVVLEFDT